MPNDPPSTLTDALHEVEGELRRGAHEAALRRALDLWQTQRAVELAELVEALTWLAARERAPIAPKIGESRQAAWLARAAEDHPADIDLLVGTILNATRGQLSVQRVVALKEVTPHPRLARALQDLVGEAAQRSSWHKRVAEPAVHVLTRIGDPRSLAWARKKVDSWPKRRAVATRRALEEFLSSHHGPAPTLGAAHAKVCGEVLRAVEQRAALGLERKHHQAQEGDDLLAQVYAEPNRDEPRLVYADWLVERGDPRGEFIVVQIERGAAAAPSPRERELVRQYGKLWLGPLGTLAATTGNVFERGFPAVLRLHSHFDGQFHDGHEWATVHTLDLHALDWLTSIAPLVTHRRLQAIDCLRGLAGLHLAELARFEAVLTVTRIEEARWSPSTGHGDHFPAATFPNLRSLAVDHGDPADPAALADLLEGPSGAQLEHLAWSVHDITQLAEWWPIVQRLGGSLRTLSMAQARLVSRDHTKGVVVRMERDSADEPFHRVSLRCDRATRFMRPAHTMARVIEALDHQNLSALRLHLPARYRGTADDEGLLSLVASMDNASLSSP